MAGMLNTLRFAAQGVRMHPGVRIYGASHALTIGRGSKISGGCVFNLSPSATIRLGERVWAYRGVELHTETRIAIGAGTSLQRAVLINGDVSIGRGCIFAPGVFVSSGKHVYDLKPAWPIRAQEAHLASWPDDPDVAAYVLDRPVRIDDDCWLGAHVVVAPGVRIGRGAIVGANSVVTRDVAPYAIVAGAPARAIKRRLEWKPGETIDATSVAALPYLYSGFDIEEPDGRLSATAAGEASVALAMSEKRTLEIRFIAEAAGAVSAFQRPQSFGGGEQILRWPDCNLQAVFDRAGIVSLDFSFEKPGACARLLRCGFVD